MKAQKIAKEEYVILASVLGDYSNERRLLRYDEFAKVMKARGFRQHSSGALIAPKGAHLFEYKQNGCSGTTLVRPQVQESWKLYLERVMGWNADSFTTTEE